MMLQILKIVFWISLIVIGYSYIFYGIIVWLLTGVRNIFGKKDPITDKDHTPEVTLLVAVYNEEAYIRQKIENSLQLEYPEGKLKFVFITDGSTDNTNAVVKEFPRIRLLHQPERKGKIAAINRAMKEIDTPVVVFCDANTTLNPTCIKEIVKHYSHPSTGGVAGEKIVRETGKNESLAGAGEGLYWRYESLLKKLDSDFWTVVGAAGELFSIKTELFEPVPEDVLLDDFIISLKIAQRGYRIIYEPAAYAIESPSLDIREEQKRKIRISAGGFQSIVMLKPLLNFFKYPVLSFQYISHRVLRWAVCPFLLPVIFILNLILAIITRHPIYISLFLLQFAFYLLALMGYRQALRNKKSRILYIPYYFVFMNLSLYIGLKRFIGKTQSVLWEKAERKGG